MDCHDRRGAGGRVMEGLSTRAKNIIEDVGSLDQLAEMLRQEDAKWWVLYRIPGAGEKTCMELLAALVARGDFTPAKLFASQPFGGKKALQFNQFATNFGYTGKLLDQNFRTTPPVDHMARRLKVLEGQRERARLKLARIEEEMASIRNPA